MKRIIIVIILLILSTLALSGQDRKLPYRKNTLYVVYQPMDFGWGARYDRMINQYWGSYVSLTYGDYTMESGQIIDEYYKLTSGVLIYLTPHYRNRQTYLGVGLCYNVYDELYTMPPLPIPTSMLDQWSFELSANTRISNKFNVGLRIDPIILNGSIDFGISF